MASTVRPSPLSGDYTIHLFAEHCLLLGVALLYGVDHGLHVEKPSWSTILRTVPHPVFALAIPKPGRVAVVQEQGKDTQDAQAAGRKLLQTEGDTRVQIICNKL